MTKEKKGLTRRGFIQTAGGVVLGLTAAQLLTACSKEPEAPPSIGPVTGSGDADPLKGTGKVIVADPGGPFTEAWAEAYHQPFAKATGITSLQVAREHEPVAHVKTMVDSGAITWDSVVLTQQAEKALAASGLLEKLKWDELPFEKADLMPEARTDYWMGTDVFAVTLAYRSDKFTGAKPQNWADFWDVKKFPGRRALQKSAINTIEVALLADGVDPKQIYAGDVDKLLDRALKKLDEIKPHVTKWWSSGSETTQGLQTGEMEIACVYNARAQTAVDGGAPIAISWNGGFYGIEGLSIPKGAPNRANAQKFIAFTSRAQQMAVWAKKLAYGPTNLKAYDFIDKERAKLLPTYEANLKQLFMQDHKWWAANLDKATERFNAWLLTS